MTNKVKKQVWVNPVERISYQGRHKQVYTIRTDEGIIPTTSMKKVREDDVAHEFSFAFNPYTNRLHTGLDELVTNPFYNMEINDIIANYSLANDWLKFLPEIIKADKVKKQTIMEIEHGVEPDLYTSEVKHTMTNLPSDMADWGRAKTYLQRLKLILYPRPNPFDNSSPRQELLMQMIYHLPIIAKSKAEANPVMHDWFISQENEEELERSKKQDIIEEAIASLYKLKTDYPRYKVYQTAIILRSKDAKPIIKGTVSDETVKNTLSRFINTKDHNQMDNIEQFMNTFGLLKSKEGVKKFEVMYLVQQALNYHIIGHRDNEFIWHSKAGSPDVYKLGSNYERMIAFFLKEYNTYNPKSDITNWYKELLEELKVKNVWIE